MDNSIELPQTTRCAFCDYLSGRRPYTVVRRNDEVATLVTREQRGIGHVLVVPIPHCPTILDLTSSERCALIDEVAAAARAIDKAFGRPGIAVWQNNGLPAGQAIPHVHFHVAGTLPAGGTERGNVEELSLAATDAIAQVLAPHLLDSQNE